MVSSFTLCFEGDDEKSTLPRKKVRPHRKSCLRLCQTSSATLHVQLEAGKSHAA